MIWLLIPILFIITFEMLFSMVSEKDNKYVLWPEYFNKSIPQSGGRRVPLKLATQNPTIEEIAKAAKKLKLNPKIEPNKAHPSKWWHPNGRVLVQAKANKTKIIRQIAIILKKNKK